MTVAGNLTVNVYQLLARNPHVPAILCLTKSDLFRHERKSKKFLDFEKKRARTVAVMNVIDKITEGHLKGKEFKSMSGPGVTRPRENIIQMKPLTVEIEESGHEMLRPMRVNRSEICGRNQKLILFSECLPFDKWKLCSDWLIHGDGTI